MDIHLSFWVANIIVSMISVLVLAGLLFVYGKNFRSIRSTFSVGLVLFAVLFLVQSVAQIAFCIDLAGAGYKLDVAMPMLALNIAELSGFIVLFWISWS